MASDHRIEHISHPGHPLVLHRSSYNTADCTMCRSECSTGLDVYACEECKHFIIHESCAKLPPKINHPFHPQHPLNLFVKSPYGSKKIIYKCNACAMQCWGSTYHCPECQFDLDIHCATLLIPRKTIESSNTQTTSHPHTLFLCNTENNSRIYSYKCYACRLPLDKDSIYVCLECRKFLCQSCAELPRELNHPFHPDHTLVLLVLEHNAPTRSTLRCSACHSNDLNKIFFHCLECEFYLDIRCSSLMPINVVDDVVNHPHPLFLCENKKKFEFFCACQKLFNDIDSISIFWCLTCTHFLHKSCAGLPVEIKQHIFHPNHPLSLSHSYDKEFDCNACMQQGTIGFAYVCNCCSADFCTRCVLKAPLHTINSELHKHPLAFVSQMNYHDDGDPNSAKPICTLCDFYCEPNWLRCVPCNINFHFHCIPNLPQKVNDGIHRHALTLTKSPIKDHEDEGEDSEFLCDHCEQERRLRDPTYYCAECHYVSHIHCLIPEIILLMDEEWSLTHKLDDTNEVANSALEGTKSQIVEVTEQYSLAETEELDQSDKLGGETVKQHSLKEALKPEELDKFIELYTNARVQRANLRRLKKRLEAFEKRAQLLDLS